MSNSFLSNGKFSLVLLGVHCVFFCECFKRYHRALIYIRGPGRRLITLSIINGVFSNRVLVRALSSRLWGRHYAIAASLTVLNVAIKAKPRSRAG